MRRFAVLGPLWTHLGRTSSDSNNNNNNNSDSDSDGNGNGNNSSGGSGSSEKRAILADLSLATGPPPPPPPKSELRSKQDRAVSVSAAAARDGRAWTPGQVMDQEGGDGTVRWVQKRAALPLPFPFPLVGEARKAGEAVEWETESVTTRYWVDSDGEAVLVKMVVGSWLRIGKIKVEGSTFKPARAVLEGWGTRVG